MADPTEPELDDPFLLAGEYVLGTLEGGELNEARRAQLSRPDFASAVEWWEWKLGAMAEAAGEFQASADVWRGIVARLDAAEAGEREGSGVMPIEQPMARPAGWSIATALAGAAMAAFGIFMWTTAPSGPGVEAPPVVAPAPSRQLVAQLQDEESGRRLASVIDTENRRLALNITGLTAEEGQAPELWVIPEGGAPVSLGYIPEEGDFRRDLSDEESGLLARGATLAVTFEEDVGTRHEAPTPPILLAGALDEV
ncbi:anti-sigma factor [Altererythrobacter arenosus]|uniref:Anti-sigma factor n=1 Tax=Altererythrobacter arenosus TaxID=3032592 RepID=A0ABY8FTE5_9SPHN|nr:anti-sigma factor [Altererythrobacter sp. CAU 1644]WFL78283.1 anti-sigma factor [Altererythrobacter sp. CAU 1644]